MDIYLILKSEPPKGKSSLPNSPTPKKSAKKERITIKREATPSHVAKLTIKKEPRELTAPRLAPIHATSSILDAQPSDLALQDNTPDPLQEFQEQLDRRADAPTEVKQDRENTPAASNPAPTRSKKGKKPVGDGSVQLTSEKLDWIYRKPHWREILAPKEEKETYQVLLAAKARPEALGIGMTTRSQASKAQNQSKSSAKTQSAHNREASGTGDAAAAVERYPTRKREHHAESDAQEEEDDDDMYGPS